MKDRTIGLLGLQGAIEEHEATVKEAGKNLGINIEIRQVLLPEDLDGLDGIIMPGGESTAMIKQGSKSGLLPALRDLLANGFPAFGTCAGAILLAKRVKRNAESEIKEGAFPVLDMTILRNGYGRQKDSFSVPLHISKIETDLDAIFIRAPIIEEIGEELDVLASFDGHPVIVQKEKILASTFHPELSGNTGIHQYFLKMIS
ncbi:MAG: pyridoxal 5'-phosphate synthase glutaminase subunit PdxT [Methanobacteriota archaeon]|nr:MAG: pyridoxal 5'-phosphate synthase glutaminase subunit PdxT [Euryarchaeota archaeon]